VYKIAKLLVVKAPFHLAHPLWLGLPATPSRGVSDGR